MNNKIIEGKNQLKETILIVDDEEMVNDVLTDMLEYFGYKVLTSLDGKNGINTFSKNKDNIDLVILDLGLPDMQGGDVLKKMLLIKETVKVIISSGKRDIEINQGIFIKAKGFLGKPFTIQSLKQVITNTLNNL